MTETPTSPAHTRHPLRRILGAIAFTALALWIVIQDPVDSPEKALVVYCSHTAPYAQDLLDQFSIESGIPVIVRYHPHAEDPVADIQSVGDAFTADLFWSDGLFDTLALAEHGLLQGYQGEGWKRIPEAFRDPEGLWASFGARLQVWVVNTNLLQATEEQIRQQLATGDLRQVGMRKPLYDDSLVHYSMLWSLLGGEASGQLHEAWISRGLRFLGPDRSVSTLVASGVLAMGLSNTDDALSALDAGAPLALHPANLPNGRHILIPNTVGILKAARHPEKAQQLVDFLLSAENETRLANPPSGRIPLGPVDEAELPPPIATLKASVSQGQPLQDLLPARKACEAWLRSVFP